MSQDLQTGCLSEWAADDTRIQYFDQAQTLKGVSICDISQVIEEFGISEAKAGDAIEFLVHEQVVDWLQPRHSFRLLPNDI